MVYLRAETCGGYDGVFDGGGMVAQDRVGRPRAWVELNGIDPIQEHKPPSPRRERVARITGLVLTLDHGDEE